MPPDEPLTAKPDAEPPRATMMARPGGKSPTSDAPAASEGAPSGTEATMYPAGAPSEPGSAARKADEDPLVGAVIADRYRLLERVGEGGMGAVYRGEHLSLKKRVAVKFLHAELSRINDVVARFEREAVAAANLEHPNVVAAHDFGKTADGQFFLVMEFVEGGSLRDLLATEKRLAPTRALHIARHIAAALSRAHAKEIVHRDLKPENVVLVERDGDRDFAKVIDFGIAKVSASTLGGGAALTQAGMVFGTPDYMAPEQALGANVDHRADLYAFGVMLFEMFTGQRPFAADDVVALLGKHMTAPPPAATSVVPPGALPPAIDAVLARVLAKSPGERFQSATEVIQALEVALGVTHQSIMGTPPMGITAPVPSVINLPASPSGVEPSLHFGTAPPSLAALSTANTLAPGTLAAGGGAVARPTLQAMAVNLRDLRGDPRRFRVVVGGLAGLAVLAVVLGVALRPAPHQPAVPVTPPPAVAAAPGGAGVAPVRASARPSEGPRAREAGSGAAANTPPPATNLPPALAAELARYRAQPEVAALLADTRGRRLNLAIQAFEQTRAQTPGNGVIAYLLGTLYARSRNGAALAVERYAEALRLQPGFAADATLQADVVEAYTSSRRPPPEAEALLTGPLAPHAVGPLLATALDGRGASRSRAAALLRSPAFESRLDATSRSLLELARADTCEERRVVVERLGREGDARALPHLRRIRVGQGCGLFGMGVCNPCLTSALPAAIEAIEQRSR